ncbi:MAG: fatty acid desaturase, partial [bacterium]|nr:fatty acid desaturase [bacterium]
MLVPYHAWRISHQLHHQFVSHVDRDVVWGPLTKAQVLALPTLSRWIRLRVFPLSLPFYLLRGTPGREYGSHYNPRSSLFPAGERRKVGVSIALCGLWLAALALLAAWQGPTFVLRHWALPWLVFCVWAALVTYLHHTDPAVPWYREEAWTPLLGALATVDRSYGVFEALHHHAGSHTAHHLFPEIPHHELRRATDALRPVLGEALRESRDPIWRALITSARSCQVIPPAGGVVRYSPLVGGAVLPESDAASRPATR